MLSKTFFKEDISPRLIEKFSYTNPLQVPRLEKISLNIGVSSKRDRTALNEALGNLADITGQKAIATKAKKAIAGFKIRQGNEIGAKVTLRGTRMYEFLSRLIHNTLPRVRDFRGISKKGFDGRGNYTLGIKDISVFQEIQLDKVKNLFGLNITFVTSAQSDNESLVLLEYLGMPFRR